MRRLKITEWSALAAFYVLVAAAWTWTGTASNSRSLAETVLPPEHLPPGSASYRALHDAGYWWTQSVQAANDTCDDERAALKAWDPAAVSDPAAELRRLMVSDPNGYLLRARRAAARAAALARTPVERRRAAWQRERLERAANRREAVSQAGESAGGQDDGGRASSREREPPVRQLD